MPNQDHDEHEVEPIGWNAIDDALAPVYGKREPKHYGTILPMMLGGNDPLQGISVYKNLVPEPHYHFITYGFSELYEKETNDPEYSGYGFELTFRLACEPDSPDEPPPWPLNFLQNLARYVFKTGNAFDERHHMTLNGPIAIGEATDITAILLTLDPELQEMDTRNGHVKFLQVVGLCGDEYDLVQQGYFGKVSEVVSSLAPLAITDICRSSVLRDMTIVDSITSAEPDATQREVFGTIVNWKEASELLELCVGATVIPQLKHMLRSLAAKGGPIAVYGKGGGIVFEIGEDVGWRQEESLMVVSLTEAAAACFGEELQPTRGEYRNAVTGKVFISVAAVDIKDADGKVIKTIG